MRDFSSGWDWLCGNMAAWLLTGLWSAIQWNVINSCHRVINRVLNIEGKWGGEKWSVSCSLCPFLNPWPELPLQHAWSYYLTVQHGSELRHSHHKIIKKHDCGCSLKCKAFWQSETEHKSFHVEEKGCRGWKCHMLPRFPCTVAKDPHKMVCFHLSLNVLMLNCYITEAHHNRMFLTSSRIQIRSIFMPERLIRQIRLRCSPTPSQWFWYAQEVQLLLRAAARYRTLLSPLWTFSAVVCGGSLFVWLVRFMSVPGS